MDKIKTTRNRCPHCARRATECWVLPCLELEIALTNGEKAVNTWCKQARAPFKVEAKKAS